MAKNHTQQGVRGSQPKQC